MNCNRELGLNSEQHVVTWLPDAFEEEFPEIHLKH
jgi:hypothetical protein